MRWDIAIGIGLGLLVVFTTVLGGQIASDESWQKWAFYISGSLMLILIVAQTVRNAVAQRDFDGKLAKIEKNTEQSPKVEQITNNIPAPAAPPAPKQKAYIGIDRVDFTSPAGDTKYGLNVYLKNTSEVAAKREYSFRRAFVIPTENEMANPGYAHPVKGVVENDWKSFDEWFDAAAAKGDASLVQRQSLGPGLSEWGTAFIDEPSSQLQGEINSGTKTILIVASAVFYDDAGRHRIDYCEWVQLPVSFQTPVFHSCGIHDGIRY